MGRSRAHCVEGPAGPPVMTEAGGKLRARLALPYRRTPALVRSRRNAICSAWSSAAPSPARCEPIPAFLLILACAIASARPWNIRQRVEHRGAHQGRFHSPRCFSEARVRRKGPGAHGAELAGLTWLAGADEGGRGPAGTGSRKRGLVRERGETKRRKPERTESDDNQDGGKQGKAEGRGGRARGQKRGQGAKKPQKSAPIWLKEHKLPL